MSIRFTAAVVEEQGVRFAVVLVKPFAVQSSAAASQTMASFQSAFPGVPIVLAAEQSGGEMQFRGRRDLVDFLAALPWDLLPWADYTYG